MLIAATAWIRKKTLDRATEKTFLGHEPLEGDLRWDRRTTALYPMLCVFAGIAAGCSVLGAAWSSALVGRAWLFAAADRGQPSAHVVFITATAQVWIGWR